MRKTGVDPQVRGEERGYALLTLMIFVTILIIAGAGYFALAGYETKGALYREFSSEAFYLADGAVEHARARFLDDRAWWLDPPYGIPTSGLGNGTYALAVRDTTNLGLDDTVVLDATGIVKNATRRIRVLADVPPSTSDLPLWIGGDADVVGNLCVDGTVHVNGDPDFGNNDVHLACGTLESEFDIFPPPIYTDETHFPGATYYTVKGIKVGPNYQANVYDRWGNDISIQFPTRLQEVTSYNNGSGTYTFAFDNPNKINTYFADPGGQFARTLGDTYVVVNFGEAPVGPGGASFQALVFDGNSSSNIHATVINTRFTGSTPQERLDSDFWVGALVEVKQVIFEPYGGIAILGYDLKKTGSSQVQLGTTTWPALVYITRDVVTINSNFDLVGSLIVLRDYHSTGGPNISYNGGFIPNLPGYLRDDWPHGVSGTLKIRSWRELASGS